MLYYIILYYIILYYIILYYIILYYIILYYIILYYIILYYIILYVWIDRIYANYTVYSCFGRLRLFVFSSCISTVGAVPRAVWQRHRLPTLGIRRFRLRCRRGACTCAHARGRACGVWLSPGIGGRIDAKVSVSHNVVQSALPPRAVRVLRLSMLRVAKNVTGVRIRSNTMCILKN